MKTKLTIIVTLFAVMFIMIGTSATFAQTVTPSKVAYNFGHRGGKTHKAHRRTVRKSNSFAAKSAAPTVNLTTAEAKMDLPNTSFEKEVGDEFIIPARITKADGTTGGLPKILGDFSKSTTIEVWVGGNNEINVKTLLPNNFKNGSSSTAVIEIGSEDFPGLRGLVTVKVKKTEVTEVTADAQTMNADATSQNGEFLLKANGSDSLAVRLKAESDNDKAVLVSFDPDNRMKLIVTMVPGAVKDKGFNVTITVTALDGAKDLKPLTLTVAFKAGDGSGSTIPPPSGSSVTNGGTNTPAAPTTGSSSNTTVTAPAANANSDANTTVQNSNANSAGNSNVAPKTRKNPIANN